MQNNRLVSYSILFLLAFTWGSSFILMKLGMEDSSGTVYTWNEVAAMRMSFAFLFLLPFGLYHLKNIKKNKILPLIVVGISGNAVPAFLFTYAETGITPSLAGMLNSTVPIFSVSIAVLVFKNRLKTVNYLGLFLGFLGSIGIILANGTDKISGEFGYSAMVLLATLCYAISVNTIRNYLADVNSVAITSFSFLVFGPVLLVYLLFGTDFLDTFQSHPSGKSAFGYTVILAIGGTALAVILFNYLVKMTNAVFASSVTYLIPITAIFWGLIFKEPMNAFHFIFMGVILVGVWLLNKK